jgi:phospholipid N-methyltransferase
MTTLRRLFLLLAAVLLWQAAQAKDEAPLIAGPYVPSPDSAVAAMLREADVGPDDYVIDLGSGDGRIVRTAALVFGARGMGVDIQDDLVRLSNEMARQEGIADRVRFVTQDLFKTDISAATVVTIYLLPHTVNLLQDKLLGELRPGARVVVHDYGLVGWLPRKTLVMDLEEKVAISGSRRTTIYVYIVPARVAGTWAASVPPTVSKGRMRLELTQQVSQVGGRALLDGRAVPLADARLVGDELSFSLPGRKAAFRGRVSGTRIEGTVDSGGVRAPWSATLGG